MFERLRQGKTLLGRRAIPGRAVDMFVLLAPPSSEPIITHSDYHCTPPKESPIAPQIALLPRRAPSSTIF